MHSSTRGICQRALLPSGLANDFDVLAQVTDKEEKSSIDKIWWLPEHGTSTSHKSLSCIDKSFFSVRILIEPDNPDSKANSPPVLSLVGVIHAKVFINNIALPLF